MAVYTSVSHSQAQQLFTDLDLGELHNLTPCEGGIENTNYFVDTSQGRYVLTLFERLTHAQLPYYLRLMQHLAARSIPVANPKTDAAGEVLFTLCGKPAAVVQRLMGNNDSGVDRPVSVQRCAQVGCMLAQMHLAAEDFAMEQENLRSIAWWNETIPTFVEQLAPAQRTLILGEIAYQNHVAQSATYKALPRGPVHADLFRNNVMFDGERLSGFFDFYFAGNDAWLFDLCVCLNDWCVQHSATNTDVDGMPQTQLQDTFFNAYTRVRPLSTAERKLLPAFLRAAALRFWISRLWDWYLPRQASVLTPHDPAHFERILQHRMHFTP